MRGSAGLFYDRVPLRALANALLSAGNTTDLGAAAADRASACRRRRPARRSFPNILTGVVPSVTLPNLTTMDRDLQNAYSRQASVEIEQQLGERTTVSVGYQYLRGRNLLMSVNQNVPTCVAVGHQQRLPAESRPTPTTASTRRPATRTITACTCRSSQRPARWGHYRVSYTLSKSMNNVGEFFFSSPIDPFDLSKDWGRSDDDQRHRLVISARSVADAAAATRGS